MCAQRIPLALKNTLACGTTADCILSFGKSFARKELRVPYTSRATSTTSSLDSQRGGTNNDTSPGASLTEQLHTVKDDQQKCEKATPVETLALALVQSDATKPYRAPRSIVRWSDEELKRFERKVYKYILSRTKIKKINWEAMTKDFPGRTALALSTRYRLLIREITSSNNSGENKTNQSATQSTSIRLGKRKNRILWTPMEDNALRTAVDIYGNRKWPMIADFVGTRTYMQCYQRWRVLQTPLSGVKSPITYWIHTAHQRLKLSKLMEASSGEKGRTSLIQRSEVIKALLKEQNDAIIAGQKLKSYNKLDGWAPGGRVLIESFSPQEDSRLLRLVKSYGDNWAFIAKVLSSALHADKTDPGDTRSKMSFRRNPETVKKRYSQLVAAFSGDIVSLGVDSIDKALTTADDSTSEQLLLIPPRIHRRSGNNKGKPLRRRHQWSAEETAKLKSVITQMINDENMFVSWKEVSRRMGEHQRSPAQCMSHWQQTCSDHIRREPFSKMEDRLLWPFVVSRSMRPLRSRNDPRFIGRTITAKYDRGEGREPSVIGFGWLSSGPMAGRTTYMVRARVLRLQQVVVWLRVVAKVEDAEKHFDLVRGLADSPCQFWNRPESLGAPS